jgi:hypothetical protein
MANVNERAKKPKRLFGARHPLLKFLILAIFVALTGGLGLIVIAIGYFGDRALEKRKAKKADTMQVQSAEGS